MSNKNISRTAARLAALGLALQACTPDSPKANVPDGSITGVKIANEVVLSAHIKDGTIATADLADAQITTAKLASNIAIVGTTSSWSGAVTMASTLGVTGNTTVGGTMGITGNTTVGGTMGITGITTLTGATNAAETITVTKIDATNHATTAGIFGMKSTMRAENTAASTESYYGAFNESVAATGFTSAQMVGTHGQVRIPTAGATATVAAAVNAELAFTATGTITTGYLFHGRTSNTAGGTPLTNYIGLYLEAPINPTFAATRYGIYSDGAIYNYIAGRLGVGNTAPDTALEVTGGLCVSDAAGDDCTTATGAINADGAITANAFDLAERFPSSKKLEDGTIVAVDPASPHYVREARPSDTSLVGIVSTKPGLVLGWENNAIFKNAPAVNLIAMAGRVPLKVSSEGGDIKIGDNVMLSSKAGIGMKANDLIERPIVGVALESFSAKKGSGSILVMVKNIETPKATAGAYVQSLLKPLLSQVKELYAKWTEQDLKLQQQGQKLASLERKIELENIALKMENKALKDRLDKIEHVLAQASPAKTLKPTAKRKLASISK